MRVIIFSLLFLIANSVCPAQTHKIHLADSYARADELVMQQYQIGQDSCSLQKFTGTLKVDLGAVYSQTIERGCDDKLYYFVGADSLKQEKYVVLDLNRNYDFSDDTIFVFKFSDNDKPYNQKPQPIVEMEYKGKPILFDVVPYSNVRINGQYTKNDFYLQTHFLTRGVQRGSFVIDSTKIYVDCYSSWGGLATYPPSDSMSDFKIRLSDNNNMRSCSLGEKFYAAGKIIRFDSLRNYTLYAQELGEYLDSTNVGMKVPLFTATDRMTRQTIDLRTVIKGKYALLDFWGSWCGPCVAAIPQVIELYEKIKSRDDVIIVGLAVERPTALAKMNQIIEQKKMLYPNYYTLWDDRKIPFTAPWVFNVQEYPTYIIVDQTGNIVYNTNKEGCPKANVIEFFEKLIK